MLGDVKSILKELKIDKKGRYDNHFYIIDLDGSDEYARAYSELSETAINGEFPSFTTNTNNNTTKITNYFEFESDGFSYNIFLIADFANDIYQIRIGEK